jgi:hypothetical protein
MADYVTHLFAGDEDLMVPVVAAVGALVLLILLLAVVLRRKKPAPASRTATVSRSSLADSPAARTPAPREIVADFHAHGVEVWRHPNNPTGPTGAIDDGAYRLGRHHNAYSVAHWPAIAGHAYRVHFRAAALADSTNGGKNNFFVGPMYLDAEGKVVGWYKEQPPISVAEGQRTGTVESVAPANAATVHIGVMGNYAKEGQAGDGVIAFAELRLVEV